MTDNTHRKRILALDLRPKSFGYVAFEGPRDLLDWGVRSFRRGRNAVRVPAEKKLAQLLDDLAPEIVVLKQLDGRKSKGTAKPCRILSATLEQARLRRIPIRYIPRVLIQDAFEVRNRGSKHEVATLVSNHFPELAFRLPPKRKCWQSEDYRMSIFDATALGVAYLNRARSNKSQAPS